MVSPRGVWTPVDGETGIPTWGCGVLLLLLALIIILPRPQPGRVSAVQPLRPCFSGMVFHPHLPYQWEIRNTGEGKEKTACFLGESVPGPQHPPSDHASQDRFHVVGFILDFPSILFYFLSIWKAYLNLSC